MTMQSQSRSALGGQTVHQAMDLDTLIRTGLHVARDETIAEASTRILASQSASEVQRTAARAILGRGEAWERMQRAAGALRPRPVKLVLVDRWAR